MTTYLALAFAGGLILNVMPCVLPILTLKAFHALEHSRHAPSHRRMHGWAYTLGTVSFFLALAGVVVALKAAGRHYQWGQQFQHPPFVAALTAFVFAFALNAIGVFEILVSAQGQGDQDEDKLWGSIVNGWFAAIMATPCSAPFQAGAVTFALAKDTSAAETFGIFGAMGLGLAAPYLVLAHSQKLARMLPRPGAWMETVKIVMGFSLFATAIWLYRTFQAQVTPQAANGFLVFLLALAFVLWAGHRFGGVDRSVARRWFVRLAGVAVLFGTYRIFVSYERPEVAIATVPIPTSRGAIAPVVVDGRIAWAPYDAKALEREKSRGRPVFMDFTAEWCANCKANEKAFLETDLVRGALVRTGILPMKADLTNENDELSALVEKLGRSGIPIYVIWLPDGTYDLLPVAITAELVVNHLDAAAKRFPAENYAVN
jgi:thiol:disulfide interchange protein DsbD